MRRWPDAHTVVILRTGWHLSGDDTSVELVPLCW